jgi:hypothetical protein
MLAERLSDHAGMFCIVRDHPAPKQEAMAIRFTKQANAATSREAFVGQADRVSHGATENRAADRLVFHPDSPPLSASARLF